MDNNNPMQHQFINAYCDYLLLQLVAVLREVKYLEIRSTEEIPDSASAMYSRNDTFRQYLANLDLTVHLYNKVRTTVLEVEFPLVEGQLEQIDTQLEKAEKSLDWNNDSKCLFTHILKYYSNFLC